MTETPSPINDISINIENEGKKYEIILSQKSNNLLIISKDLNSFPSKRYEQEFTKDNLNQISKFFRLFDDISEMSHLKDMVLRNKLYRELVFNVSIWECNESEQYI